MSARDEIFKRINAAVKQKGELAKVVASRQKTISQWVSTFFSEVEAAKGNDSLVSLALHQLVINLQRLDRGATAYYKEPSAGDSVVEIYWTKKYAETNNCEPVMALDASTAHFQAAMEQI